LWFGKGAERNGSRVGGGGGWGGERGERGGNMEGEFFTMCENKLRSVFDLVCGRICSKRKLCTLSVSRIDS
jgi:hypothetical protein